MRNLRGAFVAIGVAGGTILAGGFVIGACGGDSSAGPLAEGGPGDATADGSHPEGAVESGPNEASGGDTGAIDSSPPADSGAPDVFTADGSDGSIGSTAMAFANAESDALCKNFFSCCPALDAGSYDLAKCAANNATFGWEDSLPQTLAVYARDHLTFDSVKAAACLNALANMPCGHETAAEWAAVTQACELVIQGTIPTGQPGCISSWECADGNYCDLSDGGTCVATAGQGQRCDTVISDPSLAYPPRADEMCSYLSSAKTGLYCDLIDGSDAATYATCQPLLGSSGVCFNPSTGYFDDQACPASEALCGDNGLCGGSASYPYPGFCIFYAPKSTDAGTD